MWSKQLSGTNNLAVSDVSSSHTRRTAFSDRDEGIYEYEVDRERVDPFLQRTTNVKVVETGDELGIRTYIIMPPEIYGRGTGYFNRTSYAIPLMIENALKLGKVEYIHPGTSRSGHVHIEDLGTLFEVVIAAAIADPELPAGKCGYFFANTGEYTWYELSESIARAGHALGALDSPVPTPVSLSGEGVQWWGGDPVQTERIFAST